ncbi:MFS transporter [Aurantiacibacter gilvus]|uniref:MFS transporter n=1 Tax=Aurantiacibacter gilvus TaxID=3139141 RepID=A0ABU9IJB9_9SPHN
MATAAPPARRKGGYELAVLLLLTLGNGVVGFDRLTVAYLSPYIVADMALDNAQLGLLAAALSGAIAFSALFGGRLADITGRRKTILIACTLVFSLGSAAGGLATAFIALFLARAWVGLAEGPMVPVSQTIMAQTAAPERRGFAMGFAQMVGAFGIGGFLGPLVATQLAEVIGWRHTLFLTLLPGLLLALLIWLVLKPDQPRPTKAKRAPSLPFRQAVGTLLAARNIRVSLAVAATITAWLVLQNTFLAVYLTAEKGLTPTMAGSVISMGGLAAIIGGVGLPFLSDKLGRRPVMIWGSLAAVAAPVGLLFAPSDPVVLGAIILAGWIPIGIGPLYCATVPTESVSPVLASTAVGLVIGSAELFGGVILPPIAGLIADNLGLESVFYLCALLPLVAAVAALFLRETAPCIVAREES